jgi:hypothetical protein
MAAHGDRGNVGTLPRAPREHRAHVVDRDRAAERLGTRLEPVADLAVEIGQRQPADAALRRRTDAGGLHQVAPQALGVDAEVLHGGVRARLPAVTINQATGSFSNLKPMVCRLSSTFFPYSLSISLAMLGA